MKKYFFAVVILLVPNLIWAVSLDFTPASTDLSVAYLKAIFGTIEGVFHSSGSAVMGQIFKVFNSAILTVGAFVLMYVIAVSTINTAHSGEVLGKKWSSMWIPIRAALGIGLLLPKASGYCTIQTIMMWLILQGIGAANNIWETACNYISKEGLITRNISSTGLEDIAPLDIPLIATISKYGDKLLSISACVQGLEAELEDQLQESRDAAPADTDDYKIIPNFENSIRFDSEKLNIIAGSPSTGTLDADEREGNSLVIFFPGKFDSSFSQYDTYKGGCGKIAIPASTGDNASEYNTYRMLALQKLFTDLALVTQAYVDNDYGTITGAEDARGLAVLEYFFAIKALRGISLSGIESTNDEGLQRSIREGWISAGANLARIAKAGGESSFDISTLYKLQVTNITSKSLLLSEINSPDVPEEENYFVGLSDSRKEILGNNVLLSQNNNLDAYTQNATLAEDLVADSGDSIAEDTALTIFIRILTWTSSAFVMIVGSYFAPGAGSIALGIPVYKILTGMNELVTAGSGDIGSIGGFMGASFNPIMSIAQVGWGLMDLAITIWLGGITAMVMFTLTVAIAAWVAPGAFAVQNLVNMVAPMLSSLLTAMLAGGATLVLYVPLIPFLIFFFGVLGWFFQVLEAMVAAPLVALGVVYPEGHEAFGKAESAIMLSLNVFLRPAMMIIGLIAATMLMYVGLWLINKSFIQATIYAIFPGDEWDSFVGLGALVAFPILVIVYGLIIMTLFQKVFQLITMIPDGVLEWIGGKKETYGSEAAAGATDAVQSGVGSAASTLSSAAGGAMKSAQGAADKAKGSGGEQTAATGEKEEPGGGSEDLQAGHEPSGEADYGGVEAEDEATGGEPSSGPEAQVTGPDTPTGGGQPPSPSGGGDMPSAPPLGT